MQAVAGVGDGRLLVSNGKVDDMERNTAGGFVRGYVSIERAGRLLTIDFQNENLLARFDDGQIVASVPHLITLVEQDLAEPLASEIVRYGYRVSERVLLAPEPLTAPQALQFLGLKTFVYDFPHYDYTPTQHRSRVSGVLSIRRMLNINQSMHCVFAVLLITEYNDLEFHS